MADKKHTATWEAVTHNNSEGYIDIQFDRETIASIVLDPEFEYDAANLINGEPDTRERTINERREKAAFIVRACNAHEELLETLENEIEALVVWQNAPMIPADMRKGIASHISTLRAAIAKARGGEI